MLRKWIANNDSHDIFFLYLYNFMGLRILNSNIPNLEKHTDLAEPIKKLLNKNTMPETLDVAGLLLISRIKEMDELSKYYLPPSALDNKGKFVEELYDALLEELLDKKLINIKSWIPYAPEKNPKQFQRLLRETVLFGIRNKERQGKLRVVSKKTFQSRLKNKFIVDAYLDCYSENLAYYYYSSNTENCFLLQDESGEVKLIVFTWVEEYDVRFYLNKH